MDFHGHVYLASVVLLVLCLLMGAALVLDLGGFATRMFGERKHPFTGRQLPARPRWQLQVMRVWVFVFGIGQFLMFGYLLRP